MSANAIERIDRCLRNPVIPNQYDADARDALAAVKVLLEAADTWAYERRRWVDGEAPDRAAMQDAEVALVHAVLNVRRVETGQ